MSSYTGKTESTWVVYWDKNQSHIVCDVSMPPYGQIIVRVVAFTAEEALKKAQPEIDTFMGRTPDQEISLGDLVDVLGNDYIDGKDEKSFHFCVNNNGSYDIEAQTGFVHGGKADYLDWLARWRDDIRQKNRQPLGWQVEFYNATGHRNMYGVELLNGPYYRWCPADRFQTEVDARSHHAHLGITRVWAVYRREDILK